MESIPDLQRWKSEMASNRFRTELQNNELQKLSSFLEKIKEESSESKVPYNRVINELIKKNEKKALKTFEKVGWNVINMKSFFFLKDEETAASGSGLLHYDV